MYTLFIMPERNRGPGVQEPVLMVIASKKLMKQTNFINAFKNTKQAVEETMFPENMIHTTNRTDSIICR